MNLVLIVLIMRRKVERNVYEEITYTEEHWNLLREKRNKAVKILSVLNNYGIKGYIYGSVARGDVHKESDIDIIIFSPPPIYKLELVFEEEFKSIYSRELVQATPNHAIKMHIYIDPLTTVTVPLVPLSKLEYEFYRFGGIIDIKLARDYRQRVPGVDKRLVLIIPTKKGHIGQSIIGMESYASKLLGVSIDIIKERISVLSKRDEKGRTGTFLKKILMPDESVDEVLRNLMRKNPKLRNLIKKRGLLV